MFPLQPQSRLLNSIKLLLETKKELSSSSSFKDNISAESDWSRSVTHSKTADYFTNWEIRISIYLWLWNEKEDNPAVEMPSSSVKDNISAEILIVRCSNLWKHLWNISSPPLSMASKLKGRQRNPAAEIRSSSPPKKWLNFWWIALSHHWKHSL